MIRRNMAKETVTEDEFRSHLRTQGVFKLEDAEEIYMEGDGQISVRRRDADPPSSGNKDGPPCALNTRFSTIGSAQSVQLGGARNEVTALLWIVRLPYTWPPSPLYSSTTM